MPTRKRKIRSEPKSAKKNGNKSGYKFRDELGRLWNGTTCPECEKAKNKVEIINEFTQECKKCKQQKKKIRAELRPLKKGKKAGYNFRDINGRMWQGNTCPECFWPAKKKYEVDKEKVDLLEFNPDPLTKRKCRKCKGFLPKSLYFRHRECVPRDLLDLVER